MNASTGIGYPFSYVEPLKKRPNPYCRSGSERFVAHQCERRSIPLGIWLRQNSNGLPKTATRGPRPTESAAGGDTYEQETNRARRIAEACAIRLRPHEAVRL